MNNKKVSRLKRQLFNYIKILFFVKNKLDHLF